MSCCCPYCMSELDINKIKYYVKVENEPSQPKLKAFLAVNKTVIFTISGHGIIGNFLRKHWRSEL